MFTQWEKKRFLSLILLGLSAILIWYLPTSGIQNDSPYLQVHFLDVGQGDAIFIETPDNVQVLVDGGPNQRVLQELSGKMNFSDFGLDMVIGTHPDSDHIGGLVGVLERYQVDTLLVTDNKGDSQTAALYNKLIAAEGAAIIYARRGQVFSLGASTTLEVLWPETDTTDMESNASSIVLRIIYGKTSFLLTGDAPKRIEEYLVLAEGESLQSDVLKIGHHGSRTSTAQMFLEEVRPEYAVISAGENNRYGHPHVEVTDMLFNSRVKTLNTAEEGTITFLSDGEKVWVE